MNKLLSFCNSKRDGGAEYPATAKLDKIKFLDLEPKVQ